MAIQKGNNTIMIIILQIIKMVQGISETVKLNRTNAESNEQTAAGGKCCVADHVTQ